MKKDNGRKLIPLVWHSVANPSYGGVPEQEGGKKKGNFVPSPDQIRKWAHESHEGGTAQCKICGVSFAMYYMRWCKIGTFQNDFVCNDCRKKNSLVVIK